MANQAKVNGRERPDEPSVSVIRPSVARYQGPLLGFFFRNTRDRQLSEDFAQETLSEVLHGKNLPDTVNWHVLAELACLTASCLYAFGAVYSRRVRTLPPAMVATGQLGMSTVLLLPVVLIFDRPSVVLSASSAAIAAMVSIALLSSALAYLIRWWIY